MSNTTQTQEQFDSRPHQQGVEHGPYVPGQEPGLPVDSEDMGVGFGEHYRQLGHHNTAVNDAYFDGRIGSETHKALSKGINDKVKTTQRKEIDAVMEGVDQEDMRSAEEREWDEAENQETEDPLAGDVEPFGGHYEEPQHPLDAHRDAVARQYGDFTG